MRTASFVLAYLISCQLACKPQAEDKSADTRNASKRRDTPATPFLTGSDVKPGKLPTLSADEVRAIIHRNPVFYAQEDSGGQKKDAFGRCVDDLLNNGSIKAKGETLTFSYEFDASSCISKLGNPEGFEGSVRYKYFTMMLCKDADVSFLDGKNRADMKANSSKLDKVCESSSTQAILLNIQMDFDLSGTIESDGVTYEYHTKRRNISARYSSPMQPCKSRKNFEGNWEHEDGCVALSRSITLVDTINGEPQETHGKETYERYESVGLVSAPVKKDATWHLAGKFKTQVNGWKGEVTYSGPSSAAKYKLKQGSETITGKIS